MATLAGNTVQGMTRDIVMNLQASGPCLGFMAKISELR